MIKENNIRKNAKRIKHMHPVGDKILITADPTDPKFDPKYLGPFPIVQVNKNGTVKYCRGAILGTVNIRNIHPYKE